MLNKQIVAILAKVCAHFRLSLMLNFKSNLLSLKAETVF